jgi:hypothetical protein
LAAKLLGFFNAVERTYKINGATLNAVTLFAFGGLDFPARGATYKHNCYQ